MFFNLFIFSFVIKIIEKFVFEFCYVCVNVVGFFVKFMDYIIYGYMIDNVVFFIIGIFYECDICEFFDWCYFLGWFEIMFVFCVVINIEEFYNSVFIEIFLVFYFKGSFFY